MFRVIFKDIFSSKIKERLIRFKITPKGTSSFLGLIIGGRALDCVENGGLGHSPQPRNHFLAGLGIHLERMEDTSRPRDKHGLLQMRYRCNVMADHKLQWYRPVMSIFDASVNGPEESESEGDIPGLTDVSGDSEPEEQHRRWHATYSSQLQEGSKGDET